MACRYTIDGPFADGAAGRLRPAKGFAVAMRFVSVGSLHFTVESPARCPFFFGWLVGARVRTGLPVTLARLKRLLESRRPGHQAANPNAG